LGLVKRNLVVLSNIKAWQTNVLFDTFFQALTYRVGHHTTSDDSTKYRPANEIEWWRVARDPVARFRKWLENNGWWNARAESELINNLRQQVINIMLILESILIHHSA